MNHYQQNMDLALIKKNAKKSWADSFKGKEMLGHLPEVSLKEVPYYVLKENIDHAENMLCSLEISEFMRTIIKRQLTEDKLLFIYRYEWEFGSSKAPFGMKWIFDKYKDLYSSRGLHQYLVD